MVQLSGIPRGSADDAGDIMVWASRKTTENAFTVTGACLFVILRDELVPCDSYEEFAHSLDEASSKTETWVSATEKAPDETNASILFHSSIQAAKARGWDSNDRKTMTNDYAVYVICHGLRNGRIAGIVQTLVEMGSCKGSIYLAPNIVPQALFVKGRDPAKDPALCIGYSGSHYRTCLDIAEACCDLASSAGVDATVSGRPAVVIEGGHHTQIMLPQTYPLFEGRSRPRVKVQGGTVKRLTYEHIYRFVDLQCGRSGPRPKALKHMLSSMQAASVLMSPGLWAAGYPKADRVFERSQSIVLTDAIEPLPHALDITSALHAAISETSGLLEGLPETLGASSHDPRPPNAPQSLPGLDISNHMKTESDTAASDASSLSSGHGSKDAEKEEPDDGRETSLARALSAACIGGRLRRKQFLAAACEGMQRAIVQRLLNGDESSDDGSEWGLPPGTLASLRKRPEIFKVEVIVYDSAVSFLRDGSPDVLPSGVDSGAQVEREAAAFRELTRIIVQARCYLHRESPPKTGSPMTAALCFSSSETAETEEIWLKLCRLEAILTVLKQGCFAETIRRLATPSPEPTLGPSSAEPSDWDREEPEPEPEPEPPELEPSSETVSSEEPEEQTRLRAPSSHMRMIRDAGRGQSHGANHDRSHSPSSAGTAEGEALEEEGEAGSPEDLRRDENGGELPNDALVEQLVEWSREGAMLGGGGDVDSEALLNHEPPRLVAPGEEREDADAPRRQEGGQLVSTYIGLLDADQAGIPSSFRTEADQGKMQPLASALDVSMRTATPDWRNASFGPCKPPDEVLQTALDPNLIVPRRLEIDTLQVTWDKVEPQADSAELTWSQLPPLDENLQPQGLIRVSSGTSLVSAVSRGSHAPSEAPSEAAVDEDGDDSQHQLRVRGLSRERDEQPAPRAPQKPKPLVEAWTRNGAFQGGNGIHSTSDSPRDWPSTPRGTIWKGATFIKGPRKKSGRRVPPLWTSPEVPKAVLSHMNPSPRAEAAALKSSPYRGIRASSEPARYLSMSLGRGEIICPVSVDGSVLSPRRSAFRTPFASSPILLAGSFTETLPRHIPPSMVHSMSDRGGISAPEQLHQARGGFSISPRTKHMLTPRSYVQTTRLASNTAHRYDLTHGSNMMYSSSGYAPLPPDYVTSGPAAAVDGDGHQGSLPMVLDRMAKKPPPWPRLIDDVTSLPKAMQPQPPASHVGWEGRATLEALEARQSQSQQHRQEGEDGLMQPQPPHQKQLRKQGSARLKSGRVTFDSAVMPLSGEASLVSVASSAKGSVVLSPPQSRESVQGSLPSGGGSGTREGRNSSRNAPPPPPQMSPKSPSQTKMTATGHRSLSVFQDLLSGVERNNERQHLEAMDRSLAGKIQGTINVSRIRRGVEDGVQKRDTYALVTDRKPTVLWESTTLSEALYALALQLVPEEVREYHTSADVILGSKRKLQFFGEIVGGAAPLFSGSIEVRPSAGNNVLEVLCPATKEGYLRVLSLGSLVQHIITDHACTGK